MILIEDFWKTQHKITFLYGIVANMPYYKYAILNTDLTSLASI